MINHWSVSKQLKTEHILKIVYVTILKTPKSTPCADSKPTASLMGHAPWQSLSTVMLPPWRRAEASTSSFARKQRWQTSPAVCGTGLFQLRGDARVIHEKDSLSLSLYLSLMYIMPIVHAILHHWFQHLSSPILSLFANCPKSIALDRSW